MNKIILKEGRQRSVLKRHPWIYSGAIEHSEAVSNGETVEVFSSAMTKLGCGWYSSASQIAVRMLSFGEEEYDIVKLVASSVGRRADFFGNAYTNAVRLVNAESDSLPGVVADYYNGFVVCQFTSAGADANKQKIAETLMMFAPFCRGVCERTDVSDRKKESLSTDENGGFNVLVGEEPPELIEIFEGQCKFFVDVRRGHKTGFYLDQRDARAMIGTLANGAEVLNCFSYTGGFGLFARIAGAANVTQVDISESALELAKKNEHLVHICGTKMEYEQADVFEYLRKCRDSNKMFDMIILDPPKFASTKSQVMKAARGYKDINLLAMKLLKPNGILASFSCSGAISSELFNKILFDASVDAGRSFQTIATTRQGLDHPVLLSFPEGLYLKGSVLRAID